MLSQAHRRRRWSRLLVSLMLTSVGPVLGESVPRSLAQRTREPATSVPRAAPRQQPVAPGLDAALQATSRRLLAEARPLRGAIVAVHVPTGSILSFHEFRRPGQHGHPATRALVPAASLFKLVTTVALFEHGHVSPGERVCISGGERTVERSHLLPPSPGTAGVRCNPFEEALGHSRNAAFAQLVTEHLARRDLLEVAERLGFNRPLPFDVPAEMGVLDLPYNDLEFARAATGFRGSRLSVLGGARLALLVATGGIDRAMRLRPNTEPSDGPRLLSAETARRLRRMMEITVQAGTSLQAFSDEQGRNYLGRIRVAGKTGTLQPTPDGPITSWFVGFAPSRAPELVVSVMLDNAPVWRRKANLVARDVLRAYFHAAPGVSHPDEDAASDGSG